MINRALSSDYDEAKRQKTDKYWSLYGKQKSRPIWILGQYYPESGVSNKIEGLWSAPSNLSYRSFSNSYFGYRNDGNYMEVWDVNLSEKAVVYTGFDLPKRFVGSGSVLVDSTRVGYILEHISQKGGGLSLYNNQEIVLLKQGGIRHVSVSPDGCRVAYGEGDLFNWTLNKIDERQTLKIANICEYIEAREEKEDLQ